MNCPICKTSIPDDLIITHFRFKHEFTQEQMIAMLFLDLAKLNLKVETLCELLRIQDWGKI